MDDLYQDLQAKTHQLEVSIRQLRKSGTDYATAERDYKITLAKTAVRLKQDGMAIGLIDKVIYGVPEVAEKRFQRDVTRTVYQANLESINALKLQMRLIESQLNREWGANMSN